MFHLLQPIWLFAIAGIAIPLIIHLWNIREGKTLRVGSILLLQKSARSQARSLRLKDIFLLILRCLLIFTLAFLLAKPTWQKRLTSINKKGWILIEKESLHEAYKNFKPAIDSLIKAGYKFHYFNRGFGLDKLEDALKKTVDTNTEIKVSYWTLLKQLNEELPSELPVYLFTNNKLKRFTGTRPEVSINLQWIIYSSGNTITKPIVKAYKTPADSIRIIVANSKPAATFYTFENIVYPKKNSQYLLNDNNGKIVVSGRDSASTNSVEVDTSTLQIVIYADQFIIDAGYLKAAIDAIQEYTMFKIKVSIVNNTGNIKPTNDWLFWLSEKPLPLQKLPSKIFVYEEGKEQQINSWITTGNNFSVNEEAIHLSRLIEKNSEIPNSYEPLWKDGFGHAVLSLEKANNYTYHFYSRLNPAWNDLPWSEQFPEMIFDLLIKPDTNTKNFDNRIIDAAQFQPEMVKENKVINKQRFVETKDLTKLFWVIAFIIFFIERYISLNSNKPEVYA